ncbi:hypothetical protein K1719_019628 [Acacia pycnantha]|nr:hypothetical protein K1719_019628 [Acacia pycnantha]
MDPAYENMRAIKEKRAELEKTYARLLQHLKSLDKNCLGSLRKAYCSSLNLLLRRENKTGYDDDGNDDDLGIMDIDENDSKPGKSSVELVALNESLHDLLDGI